MKSTREFLKKLGLPEGDRYDLPDSQKTFSDGARYRFEIPGIQDPESMLALLDELSSLDIKPHRITQTKGIMSLTDDEISKMVELAEANNVELILALGPRATTDTSATVNTTEGKRMGYRLRGQDQIVRSFEDVKRATNLGCKSFLIYDEGLLWVLNQARKIGEIPKYTEFKVSAHMGHGNPCSAKLLQDIGANSINLVRDIQLQMLAAIRQTVDVPLDVHTENPASSGGFIRHYEVPEMIRVASPIYLKTGGSVAKTHNWDTTQTEAKLRAKQVQLVDRVIKLYSSEN